MLNVKLDLVNFIDINVIYKFEITIKSITSSDGIIIHNEIALCSKLNLH